jgi:hypothetical protein
VQNMLSVMCIIRGNTVEIRPVEYESTGHTSSQPAPSQTLDDVPVRCPRRRRPPPLPAGESPRARPGLLRRDACCTRTRLRPRQRSEPSGFGVCLPRSSDDPSTVTGWRLVCLDAYTHLAGIIIMSSCSVLREVATLVLTLGGEGKNVLLSLPFCNINYEGMMLK